MRLVFNNPTTTQQHLGHYIGDPSITGVIVGVVVGVIIVPTTMPAISRRQMLAFPKETPICPRSCSYYQQKRHICDAERCVVSLLGRQSGACPVPRRHHEHNDLGRVGPLKFHWGSGKELRTTCCLKRRTTRRNINFKILTTPECHAYLAGTRPLQC